MNHKGMMVGIDKKSKNTLYLPSAMKREGILSAAFGTKVVKCRVAFSQSLEKSALLSEDLFEELMIPHKSRADFLIHGQTVHIGPLIGIFTAGFTSSTQRPFRDRTSFFTKLLSLHEQANGYCFVFGAHQINWEEGTVQALIYKENSWKRADVPLPNVVYDRLPSRKTEKVPLLQQTKYRLMNDYQIPWFNPQFFNKWDIHKLLEKNSLTASLLPKTILQPNAEAIETLCSTFDTVFIKPADGTLGTGIYKLKKTDAGFSVKYTNEEKTVVTADYADAASFMKSFEENNDPSAFLLQQGIDLIRLDGRPVDFRVHTNKNAEGKWTVTAIAAKISGRNSITTHLANGGEVRTLAELYGDPKERVGMIRKLSKAALAVSRVLNEHIEGFIGEIGFDLGVDEAGKVWMFEANSRPGRSIFSHPKLRSVDYLTKRRNFEYASYLSERSITAPEKLWR
ncbi:YheC/YheD family endospore coat-associated protein [Bacillus siamensis]|uniref:YheC/YheD family endospore coat-associated protein n=1 Tax=Bacillus siamensis TaxID=659243 RepID=UPI003F67DB18